jgi:hypothetical protein
MGLRENNVAGAGEPFCVVVVKAPKINLVRPAWSAPWNEPPLAEQPMIPTVIERCVGIDVGKKFLAVCAMTGPAHGEAQAEVRKFGTVRHELESLRKWLQSDTLKLILANPQSRHRT